jgi:anti-sigma-K factor RskA
MNPSQDKMHDEYLAGFVLGELTEEELKVIEGLSEADRSRVLNELERVSASITLASDNTGEPMPERLRRSIVEYGRSYVTEMKSVSIRQAEDPTFRWREAVAWAACIAASVMALFFWQKTRVATEAPTLAPLTRESLMASASDLIQTPWTDGKTPWAGRVTGDVVWSNSMQKGFMKFVGMPINDPTVEQYQLWIIDPSRDDEPIDGGVFDISSEGESIVAIHAKLPVNRPTAFAITIEKPGGVVVSTQERLPLIAPVKPPKQQRWTFRKWRSIRFVTIG